MNKTLEAILAEDLKNRDTIKISYNDSEDWYINVFLRKGTIFYIEVQCVYGNMFYYIYTNQYDIIKCKDLKEMLDKCHELGY